MNFFKKLFNKNQKEEIIEENPIDIPVMESSVGIDLMAADPLFNEPINFEEKIIEKNEVLGIEEQLLNGEPKITSIEEEIKPSLAIPDAFNMSPNFVETIETLKTENHSLQRTQKFCQECGTPNDVLNKFCVSCGKEI